jgi:tetraacyldisaccharide 4'-kinase
MVIDKKEHELSGPLGQSFPIRAASTVYGVAINVRNKLYDALPFLSHTADRPVISIGGIRAGGTGKTPAALMVGEYLLSQGYAVAFLSRGYRRKDRRVHIIRPYETAPWEEIGDEPFLLHDRLPQSWLGIGADRFGTASRLGALLPQRAAFVLDDGFQHRPLRRNLDIVCLHEATLDEGLLPAGWLREPVSAVGRAHAALVIGSVDNAALLEEQRAQLAGRFPWLCSAVLFQEMRRWVNAGDGSAASVPPFKNPLLVCGIARPERFITMVRSSGIIPCAELIFPDHQRYRTNDFDKTRELYSKGIVTTEKDAVRLKTLGVVPAEKIWYGTVTMRFADGKDQTRFYTLIDATIAVSMAKEGL